MKNQKEKCGLGIHAVRKEKIKSQSVNEILDGICENGLDIKKGSSILATVSSLGVSSELKHHQKDAIKNYTLGSEKAENGVVILVPTILEGDSQKLYVGFPGMDTSAIGNNHKITCILVRICCENNDFGEIPPEFIFGYFKEENGERVFQSNNGHFFEMSDKQKGDFINRLSDRLTEQQKQISDAVISGDFSRLEELSIELCGNRDGILEDDSVIQNAMMYLNRNKEQQEQKQETEKLSRSRRRILLNAYDSKEINKTDLDSAYSTLSKTKEERITEQEIARE